MAGRMNAMNDAELLVNESEAARLLTLAPSTLRIWRSKGRGPRFVRLGRAVRYRIADLQAFVAAGSAVA